MSSTFLALNSSPRSLLRHKRRHSTSLMPVSPFVAGIRLSDLRSAPYRMSSTSSSASFVRRTTRDSPIYAPKRSLKPGQRFKLIWLSRHAEGSHNASQNWDLHDPDLTALGKEQARNMLGDFQMLLNTHEVNYAVREWAEVSHQAKSRDSMNINPSSVIQLVSTSPMRRTLLTSLIGFDHHLDLRKNCAGATRPAKRNGIPIVVLPELQENGPWACDTGSTAEDLSLEFPQLDFSAVPADWHLKKKITREYEVAIPTFDSIFSPHALEYRAAFVKKWLWERPEDSIFVVSHGGFLLTLLRGYSRGIEEQAFDDGSGHLGFRNAEIRLVKLYEDGRWEPVKATTSLYDDGMGWSPDVVKNKIN